MSTAGAVGFHIGGQDKVAYNHNDSYPTGLGQRVALFIASVTPERLRATAEQVKMVNEKSPEPTAAEIEQCGPWSNMSVSSGSPLDWYCLTRNGQDSLESYVEGLPFMYGHLNNTYNYAYIWNCDAGTLDYYRNFSAERRSETASVLTAAGTLLYDHGELMASIPFAALKALAAKGKTYEYFDALSGLVRAEDVLLEPELRAHNTTIATRLAEIIREAQLSPTAPNGAPVSTLEEEAALKEELFASLLESFDGQEIALTAHQRQQLQTLKNAAAKH